MTADTQEIKQGAEQEVSTEQSGASAAEATAVEAKVEGKAEETVEKTELKPKKEQNIVIKILRLVGLLVMGYFLLTLGQLLGYVIALPIGRALGGELGDTFFMYFSFIGIWVIFYLLFLIIKPYRWLIGTLSHKRAGNTLKNFGLGLAIGFGMNAFCVVVALLHKDIAIYFDRFTPWMFLVLLAVCVQSGAEELVCRGFLFEKIRKLFGNAYLAAVLNAALFGLLHVFNQGVTVLSIINVSMFGFLASLFVIYFDGYWVAIAVHTAWNFTQAILFGLPNSGNVNSYTIFKLDAAKAVDSFCYNVGFGVEGTVLADALLILVSILMIVLIERKKKAAKAVNTIN